MKRVIFIVAVVMAGKAAFAQLSFGAKAGLNIASVWGVIETRPHVFSIPGPVSPVAGAALGGFVRYDFKEIYWLGVQLDLLFSMQGGRDVSYWQMGEQYTIRTLRQNYINMPVVLDFKFFRKIPLSFLIGYQSGECVFRYADGERIKRTEGSIFNNWDNSYVLGFRYVFSERLTAELRIINSSTPSIVIDETWVLRGNTPVSEDYVYKSIGAQNLTGQLTVGWTF
ncbi:MAG: PorT family protein [Prevotellaceae bacterium]|jgi:hypothetical protein|nr:PorT family protein [Prevotellaceae bacterium]